MSTIARAGTRGSRLAFAALAVLGGVVMVVGGSRSFAGDVAATDSATKIAECPFPPEDMPTAETIAAYAAATEATLNCIDAALDAMAGDPLPSAPPPPGSYDPLAAEIDALLNSALAAGDPLPPAETAEEVAALERLIAIYTQRAEDANERIINLRAGRSLAQLRRVKAYTREIECRDAQRRMDAQMEVKWVNGENTTMAVIWAVWDWDNYWRMRERYTEVNNKATAAIRFYEDAKNKAIEDMRAYDSEIREFEQRHARLMREIARMRAALPTVPATTRREVP